MVWTASRAGDHRVVAILLLLAFSCVEGRGAAAQTPEKSTQSLEARDQVIQKLLQRVDALEREVQALRAGSSSSAAATQSPAVPEAPLPQATAPKRSVEDDEERLARAALERTLIQRGGLLLPPWTLEVEPSFSFFHSSTETISIDAFTILPFLAIGQIVSERVSRDTLVPALTLRLGLPWDFQVETRVPYLYQVEETVRADNEERTREGLGLGDIEVAVSKQFVRATGMLPDLLGSVRWKSTTGDGPFDVRSDELPTGTGFHGLQGSLTAVKAIDPVAFFGGVAYTANLPAHTRVGRIDPGDTWGFNVGLALALNLETSISLALEERFTSKTTQRGVGLPGTDLNVGIFRVGASYVLAPGLSLDVGVGIGLTRDAPDLQVTVALPVRFPR